MNSIWRDLARRDFREAVTYLRKLSPAAALGTSRAIREQVSLLAQQPGLGRPGRVENTRELVIATTQYIVAYIVDPSINTVVVLRVLHGSRQWPQELE